MFLYHVPSFSITYAYGNSSIYSNIATSNYHNNIYNIFTVYNSVVLQNDSDMVWLNNNHTLYKV